MHLMAKMSVASSLLFWAGNIHQIVIKSWRLNIHLKKDILFDFTSNTQNSESTLTCKMKSSQTV